jgi:dTDP-4-dehydrorhamnose reductase
MQDILITGAGGFLGWNLCRLWKARFRLAGTCHSRGVEIAGVDMRRVDLADAGAVTRLLDAVRPDAVVHTAALAKPNACEQDPNASFRVNVEATVSLAAQCAARGIRLVFTSTDMVFDGEHAPYDEAATPDPLSTYGRHKAQAEQGVLSVHPGALVCRLPLLFGAPGPYSDNFLPFWLACLREGRELLLFEDEFRTAVGTAAVAEGLRLGLESALAGFLHLGGKERLSRHAFGLLLADTCGLSPAPIRRVRHADVPMASPRPRDVSLDSRKAFALGYAPPPTAEQLRALRQE